MKKAFWDVLRMVKICGSFSVPFINCCLKDDILKQERDFLLSLKYSYESKNKKALKIINARLRTKPSNSMSYLLLFRKLKLLRTLRKKDKADDIYQYLRDNIANVSPNVREFIISELIGHCAMSDLIENCLGKFHVDGSCLSDSAKAFLEINVGRNLARNGNVEGLAHFKKALELARTIPHPSGMITAANALTWYGKEHNLDEAVHYAKDALYWVGWYFENPRLYVFDTALEVLNKANNTSVYEIAKDFISLYEFSPEEEKKKYKKRYTQTRHMLSTTFYKSDGKMRRFLRKLNKQNILEDSSISKMEIFNLLHSKVKNIRGETIRKIISKHPELFKEIELSKFPRGFICEMAKRKESLKDGIDAVINNKHTLDPFIQARKDLVNEYLERMPKRIRERFIQKYIAMDEKEKKIIDRFARDYIRYDIKWKMRVSVPTDMKDLIKAFHLKKTPAALGYWALDTEEEREELVNTLKEVKK